MSDEEIVREALNLIPAVDYRSEDEDAMHDGLAALSRILSERDSLRTRLERAEYWLAFIAKTQHRLLDAFRVELLDEEWVAFAEALDISEALDTPAPQEGE